MASKQEIFHQNNKTPLPNFSSEKFRTLTFFQNSSYFFPRLYQAFVFKFYLTTPLNLRFVSCFPYEKEIIHGDSAGLSGPVCQSDSGLSP